MSTSPTRIHLVTGGTSGIGRSLVRALVARGDEVHFVGTNHAKADALRTELGPDGARAHFHAVDLSSLAATRAFADAFVKQVDHLDVLANVAGVMLADRRVSDEGLELTMAIGHHSAHVLTRALIDPLAAAPHGRVVNVAGVPREVLHARVDFADPNFEARYPGLRAAVIAVHAKAVMTQVLAEELRDRAIDVNAFHPGLVRSDLGQRLPWYWRMGFRLAGPFLSDVSTAGVWAAVDAPPGLTGQLVVGTTPQPLAFDPDYREQVRRWTESTCFAPTA